MCQVRRLQIVAVVAVMTTLAAGRGREKAGICYGCDVSFDML